MKYECRPPMYPDRISHACLLTFTAMAVYRSSPLARFHTEFPLIYTFALQELWCIKYSGGPVRD